MKTLSSLARWLQPWNLPAAWWGGGLTVILTLRAVAAPIGMALVGPDSSGEYDIVWTTGVLEQASVLGQSWASAGAAGNSYHIAPASDIGNNKFFRLHDSQSFSTNILGYVNLRVPSGFSMIANQLNATPDNTLETLLPAPPEGTTIYKFDPAQRHYDIYVFSGDNPGWLPQTGGPAHTTLNPGEGAFIAMPWETQVTLVGEVQLAWNIVRTNVSIISVPIPVSDTLDNLGVPVLEGTLYPFFRGGRLVPYQWAADNVGWFPSAPKPTLGESFFCYRIVWSGQFSVGPP